MDIKESIYTKVYSFQTKYKEGFTQKDIVLLLVNFANIDISKFNNALCNITCIEISDEIIIYHHDIYNAVICGIEKRKLSNSEFD